MAAHKNIPKTPSARRLREAAATLSRGVTEILDAGDDEGAAFLALARTLASIPDLLEHPLYQRALMTGLKAGRVDINTPDTPIAPAMLAMIRRAAGLTQEQLAERLHVPQSFVANMERGARPVPAKHLPLIRDLFEEARRGGLLAVA